MRRDRGRRHLPAVILLQLIITVASCAPGPWLVYSPSGFSLAPAPPSFVEPRASVPAALPPVPDTWRIVDASFADVTGDGIPEWVLVVSRPWRDWPIMAWHGGKSPIAAFRDADGNSSHLVLMTPEGEEIWAGSALPRPMRAVAAGDIDGDGTAEVVTLEGEYADRPDRPASYLDVWKWDVFGFVLAHRSGPGTFRRLYLSDTDNDGIVEIIIR